MAELIKIFIAQLEYPKTFRYHYINFKFDVYIFQKQLFDILFSLIAILLLLPIYITISIGIKISSPGIIIYKQERIGKNGKPFIIYKFRSMIENAEKNGPKLSSKDDSRITKFGRFLRRTRLDEIPQFFNVIKGDMSIIGPRPERPYFINKIMKQKPEYEQILKIKPGISSLGQIKYGYAENINQMLERLVYDLHYVKHKSFKLDFKILLETIKVIFKANGV